MRCNYAETTARKNKIRMEKQFLVSLLFFPCLPTKIISGNKRIKLLSNFYLLQKKKKEKKEKKTKFKR